MATAESPPHPHDRADRTGRRRPFSTWVKKLTNFKGSSSTDPSDPNTSDAKRPINKRKKKRASKNNNPYPQSGTIGQSNGVVEAYSSHSFSTAPSGSATSLERSPRSDDSHLRNTAGGRSLAPTVATDHEAPHSIVAPSHGASSVAGTSRTVGGIDSRRGGDSTFSSPAPSVRSLTTTLTTIHSSMAPNGQHLPAIHGPGNGHMGNAHAHASQHGNTQSIHFNQPFPTASPASAIPAHLAPSSTGPGHPTTYNSATANNLLTDNASILTLASSSKRRRRRSFDTDASVRALAPSSLWGGSRESLPLSMLSANVDATGGAMPPTPGMHQQGVGGSRGFGSSAAERTSIYSATGVAPAPGLSGERSSVYGKRDAGDGASTRSGLLGHGRADSISGSIGGLSSPLATPREQSTKPTLEKEDGKENTTEDATAEKKEEE